MGGAPLKFHFGVSCFNLWCLWSGLLGEDLEEIAVLSWLGCVPRRWRCSDKVLWSWPCRLAPLGDKGRGVAEGASCRADWLADLKLWAGPALWNLLIRSVKCWGCTSGSLLQRWVSSHLVRTRILRLQSPGPHKNPSRQSGQGRELGFSPGSVIS